MYLLPCLNTHLVALNLGTMSDELSRIGPLKRKPPCRRLSYSRNHIAALCRFDISLPVRSSCRPPAPTHTCWLPCAYFIQPFGCLNELSPTVWTHRAVWRVRSYNRVSPPLDVRFSFLERPQQRRGCAHGAHGARGYFYAVVMQQLVDKSNAL